MGKTFIGLFVTFVVVLTGFGVLAQQSHIDPVKIVVNSTTEARIPTQAPQAATTATPSLDMTAVYKMVNPPTPVPSELQPYVAYMNDQLRNGPTRSFIFFLACQDDIRDAKIVVSTVMAENPYGPRFSVGFLVTDSIHRGYDEFGHLIVPFTVHCPKDKQ